ncbi:class F sortase [Blastococcus xanthinilyticus]|uniref:Sortase family protein n=1 Tax=Blastococcus xanthinilyticus TaxID=1564164 RepID=A0A5S5CQE4_9ACTN|nr:class F sortase [Blastococcus xanthinilyticus]TYP85913.1 sortase family protein [Blastococcus xanthinilyticus]
MGSHRRPRRPAQPLLRLLAAGVLGVAGTVALISPGTDVPAVGATAAAPVPVVAEHGSAGTATLPVRVRLPAIGVDSALVELGVDGEGVLVPPTDFARAGWFAAGPTPGEVGPSVIAGHVDSRDGPAVFFRLDQLVAGDEVLVDRVDGTTARFTVTSTERFPKDRFPTQEVYGPTPRAELKLITCGGEFDADRRSYRDNVVVTAVLG